ncbi:MAG: BglG family transcription antiterminator LicT [Cellulosilyticaceae bacterium]
MKVVKVINNNIIKSFDEKNNEILVMGCGLGFKKKPGDAVDESLIDKVYTCSDKVTSSKLIQLLENIPIEHIQTTNEIINFARHSLGKKLSENIYITLVDHIHFALERYQKGIVLKNALLWEIKKLYNHEYLVGKEALRIIEKRLGVVFPDDEAGFIAFQFVNASMDDLSLKKTADMTKLIQSVLKIVKYHFNIELDEYSVHYERFITHLKFFAQRLFTDVELSDQEEQFLSALKSQYEQEYSCAEKIRTFVNQEFQKEITEDEMIYLTVHIKRITTNVV